MAAAAGPCIQKTRGPHPSERYRPGDCLHSTTQEGGTNYRYGGNVPGDEALSVATNPIILCCLSHEQ